ncbi:MAG: type I polyketide synthase, partial [Myxococcales bacterium]|nr:type I polyketide synthase [Myxococcales bacterium]
MSRSEYAPLLEQALRRIRAAKAEVAESRRPPSSRCPIAVLGMACRLPGADDPDALWQLLVDGTDAVAPLPADHWTPEEWAALSGSIDLPTDRCGTIRDVAGFDPRFFGIAPREAEAIDPLQRVVLETAWHALEDAGVPPSGLSGRRVGVFLGIGPSEYREICVRRGVDGSVFGATGSALSVIAGRVAYALGLQGPALVLDTACSSSLVALQLAVRALQAGDCEVALTGGINLLLDPKTTLGMARLKMLSPVGQCRSFDADGAGFVRGEGCGVVVLRRLADAERDGQRCRAVIRGAAVNQDGRSAGLTAPNKHAQVAVIRAALADGGLDPLAVTYVESHGTGTALGDPIEMGAIEEALCAGRPANTPIVIGALKSNLGHLEAASGIAGLIKAVLAIEHGAVPQNLHFDTPNPHIPWARLPLHMPRQMTPWSPGLVGISSFGFSGTNAHVVIGPPPAADRPVATAPARQVEVLPFSARSPRSLRTLAARHAERLADAPETWPAIAASAALHREAMAHRATVQAASAAQAIERLRALADAQEVAGAEQAIVPAGRAPRIGFLFTGQGAQHAGMGRRLYAEEPVFARAIDRCAAHLDGRLPLPLTRVLFDDDSPIDNTAYTQPAMFALQVALAALWQSLGVTPEVVLGHSVGAYAAAVVAGMLPLEDALDLIAERGRLMGALPAGGAMAAVQADERQVLAMGRDAAWCIAAANSPRETIIAGPAEAIDRAVADFAAQGVRARRLTVSHAFHSALMAPVVAPFSAHAARFKAAAPQIDFIDDRTGALRRDAPTADDWSRHLREPVRFRDALRTLAGLKCDLLVELGPRPVLLGLARSTLGDACP